MQSRRKRLGQALLVAVGLINVVPGAGAVSPGAMRSAYGVEVGSADLEVLLRHRAVLLALAGAFVIVSAFRPALRRAAIAGGAVSMGSFLLLALTTTPVNEQVLRVAQVDAAALLLLAVGAALVRTSGEGA
ncbi:hypothetical protein SAMN04489729_7855 [Amycolatopsis lurida]|uniref:hypothetical protein n=1 Tax=Amycolatopsis lurida TaxID=31959 RepID=UPI0005566F24|nr:hypothetical protein [Amycolatopsis lurida]SEE51582.1 hypothetical protein SAMN04489729_7855 [Amycolatopsis lurida]